MSQERSTEPMNDGSMKDSPSRHNKRKYTREEEAEEEGGGGGKEGEEDAAKRVEKNGIACWHHERAKTIRTLRRCLPPISETCDFATVLENISIEKRFGDSDSNRYSDAFAAYCRHEGDETNSTHTERATTTTTPHAKRRKVGVCKKKSSTNLLPFAMKAIPFASHETSAHVHRDRPLSHSALRYSTWVERAIMLMCNELIAAECTPSLPHLIRSYVCPHPFSPLSTLQKQEDPALVLCSEWAQSGNLLQWAIAQARRPAKQWHCILFHIFVALHALQKYCNVTHHDLHLENVLLLTIASQSDDNNDDETLQNTARGPRPQKFWQYRVDGQMYYVPECLGFVPLLWDFGIAHRPHMLTNRSFRHVYEESKTIRPCVDAENLLTIISDMRDNGEISFPSTSWNPYGTVLSWKKWSLRCAIPFIFKRHFGRRPRNNSCLMEPCYDVTRECVVPQYEELAPFFCSRKQSLLPASTSADDGAQNWSQELSVERTSTNNDSAEDTNTEEQQQEEAKTQEVSEEEDHSVE